MTTQDTVIVATEEEVKKEESPAGYVPAELTTIEIDVLAKEAIEKFYQNWLKASGERVAKQAMAEAEKANKIEAIKTTLAQTVKNLTKEQDSAGKSKNWKLVAEIQAKIETAEADAAKEIAKLNKAPGSTRQGSGEMTADKLSLEEMRRTVLQFKFAGSAYVVAHSSIINSTITGKLKIDSDSLGFGVWPVEPVSVERKDGRNYAQGIPTIKGEPMAVKLDTDKLTHSALVNGIMKALISAGKLNMSNKTAKAPFSVDSIVSNAEYTWLVVKQG